MTKLNCFWLKQGKAFSKVTRAMLFLLLLIPQFSAVAQAEENSLIIQNLSTDELIAQAIKIKSSDIEFSQNIIKELKSRRYNMTWQQQDQYQYLVAYEQIILGNYQQAIDLSGANKDSRNINYRLRAYNNILFLNVLIGQYSAAADNIKPISTQLKAKQIDTDTLIKTYTTLAYFYNQLHDPQQALEYVEHILVNDNMHITDREQCFLGVQHIYALQGLNKLLSNVSIIDQYYNICSKINERLIADEIVATHAFSLLEINKPEQAIQLLQENYQNVIDQNYPQNYLRFNSYLAKAHLQLNNVSKANEFADKTLTLADEYPNHPTLMIVNKVKYEVAKFNKDNQAEFTSLQNKIKLQHELALETKDKSLALNSLRYDLDELEGELLGYQTRINNELKQEKINIANNSVFANFLISNRLIQLILAGFIIWLIRSVFINLKLKKQIISNLVIDKATDCLHRHAFLLQAEQLLEHAKKNGKPYSLAIMNIDNLREVNEIQGNDRTDRLINLMLNIHKNIFDQNTLVGRLGGDEFVFLLKDSSIKRAIELCEQYRLETNFLDTKQICYQFDVTASFGISDTEISGYSMMNLLSDTEQALKQAKDECKNCTCGFEGRPRQEVDALASSCT
ncbi:GGDEF domain-containing protein [Thalassotalea psychrophila]|uniref:diguanylate cyclase n=1 Tax=Thalassotalea psychrophila TaxID=3065647 RepID=A0ABY9TWU4_9GAMM|nr:GGDEF domain-containing protein [Colwelliaceae bacterium SQ149]